MSDSLHNEAELLREITEGNEQAFTAVYQHYHQVLYAYAFRYLKSEFWAEEVVQEIFAYLWTEKNNLSAIQNLGGWLRRLVWNKSVDRIRRQKTAVKAQYALQAFLQQNSEVTNHPNERLFTLLESAVNNLPPQRRIIYELKYKQKLSLDQIADKLQLSRNTVRNHLTLLTQDIRTYLLCQSDIFLLLVWLSMNVEKNL